jgi:hypothetical protein
MRIVFFFKKFGLLYLIIPGIHILKCSTVSYTWNISVAPPAQHNNINLHEHNTLEAEVLQKQTSENIDTSTNTLSNAVEGEVRDSEATPWWSTYVVSKKSCLLVGFSLGCLSSHYKIYGVACGWYLIQKAREVYKRLLLKNREQAKEDKKE